MTKLNSPTFQPIYGLTDFRSQGEDEFLWSEGFNKVAVLFAPSPCLHAPRGLTGESAGLDVHLRKMAPAPGGIRVVYPGSAHNVKEERREIQV